MFTQWPDHLTTHFSEPLPVVKWHMTVLFSSAVYSDTNSVSTVSVCQGTGYLALLLRVSPFWDQGVSQGLGFTGDLGSSWKFIQVWIGSFPCGLKTDVSYSYGLLAPDCCQLPEAAPRSLSWGCACPGGALWLAFQHLPDLVVTQDNYPFD